MRLMMAMVMLAVSASALAQGPVTVRERLRWVLWVEGVQEVAKAPKLAKASPAVGAKPLPLELSSVLHK